MAGAATPPMLRRFKEFVLSLDRDKTADASRTLREAGDKNHYVKLKTVMKKFEELGGGNFQMTAEAVGNHLVKDDRTKKIYMARASKRWSPNQTLWVLRNRSNAHSPTCRMDPWAGAIISVATEQAMKMDPKASSIPSRSHLRQRRMLWQVE